MTGEHRHKNHTTNGQRVSRPFYGLIFSPTHKKIEFHCHRTNGTFGFAPTAQADPSAKAKEPFFSRRTDLIVEILW